MHDGLRSTQRPARADHNILVSKIFLFCDKKYVRTKKWKTVIEAQWTVLRTVRCIVCLSRVKCHIIFPALKTLEQTFYAYKIGFQLFRKFFFWIDWIHKNRYGSNPYMTFNHFIVTAPEWNYSKGAQEQWIPKTDISCMHAFFVLLLKMSLISVIWIFTNSDIDANSFRQRWL